MEKSKALMVQAGVVPKLRLGIKKAGGGVIVTGPHRVKILEDRIIKDKDAETGKEIEFVVYLVEENGEKKEYRTKVKNREGKLNYLVQRLAEIEEGDEVILEMKKMGIKNYIEVTPVKSTEKVEHDVEDDEEEPDEAVDALA